MSDISQHGLIGTLQRLNDNPGLDAELHRLTRDRPVALVLPCHAGDLGRPALERIVEELSTATFIAEVLIPVNGVGPATGEAFSRARAFFRERLSLPHRLLSCEPGGDAPPAYRPGKGSNVWAAVSLLGKENNAAFVLTADADVTTFRIEMLARLAFALADPDLGYTFAKCYYPRVTDRIHGRVSRLFLAPLLQALVRAGGHLPLLDFLRSFRYPLAGECGMTRELALSLPFETGWGLEIGMLCDLFRRIDPRQVCQVDAGGPYDHKHQPLGDGQRGLVRMCGEIARTLLRHLAQEGVRLDDAFFEAVSASYRREAGEAVRRSAALAKINALRFEAEEEKSAVGHFEAALQEAFEDPACPPPLPAWNTAAEAEKGWGARLPVS
jgi:glucosyl-3-phosphoglycerate synthase